MKVVIGPYTTWIGPYQIADLLCWWAKPVADEHGFKSKPDWVHNFGTWLSQNKDGSDSTLTKVCQWVESKRHRQVYVRIDKWDTWGMDHTLAQIILPMLLQLKASKHGAPNTDDIDVPKELWSTNAEPKENEHDTDSNHFKRWDWVLDEMIFAFRNKLDEGKWEDQFYTGEYDFQSKATEFDENGKPKLYQLVKGPNDTRKIDMKGLRAYQKRISNGFRLFGKYYENLWD